MKPLIDYFLSAVKEVATSKARYQEAEAKARSNRPERPAWFNPYSDGYAPDDDDE